MKIQKILIAVDNNKYAEHAAQYGFELAHLYKADVGLVNIVEPVTTPVQAPDMISGVIFEPGATADPEIMNIQKEVSENLVETTMKHYAGDLKVTRFSEFGSTADGILTCSAQFHADLIVIGTHSRSGIDRLLMGSVAEHVVRHAKVPVLVVPFVEESESR